MQQRSNEGNGMGMQQHGRLQTAAPPARARGRIPFFN
jgi:hypothetical protein